jgi:hypothetical protein
MEIATDVKLSSLKSSSSWNTSAWWLEPQCFGIINDNHIHERENGLPRYSLDGSESKLICSFPARSSITNTSKMALEYPREMPEILQCGVASPLMIIPLTEMIPDADVPKQVTLDIADKFDPQFTIWANPQWEREISTMWLWKYDMTTPWWSSHDTAKQNDFCEIVGINWETTVIQETYLGN